MRMADTHKKEAEATMRLETEVSLLKKGSRSTGKNPSMFFIIGKVHSLHWREKTTEEKFQSAFAVINENEAAVSNLCFGFELRDFEVADYLEYDKLAVQKH